MSEHDYGPEAARAFRRAKRELFPKLRDSAAMLAIAPPDDLPPDPKFCMELGMAIMLNKPILILVSRGRTLDPKSALFRVADEVIADLEIDEPDSADRVQAAMERVMVEKGLLDE